MSTDQQVGPQDISPEAETYIRLLVLVHLLDAKRVDDAVALSTKIVARMDGWNRRTLDPLSSKVFFYYSRSHELAGQFADIRP